MASSAFEYQLEQVLSQSYAGDGVRPKTWRRWWLVNICASKETSEGFPEHEHRRQFWTSPSAFRGILSARDTVFMIQKYKSLEFAWFQTV